jgi:hypothetical protein
MADEDKRFLASLYGSVARVFDRLPLRSFSCNEEIYVVLAERTDLTLRSRGSRADGDVLDRHVGVANDTHGLRVWTRLELSDKDAE